MKLNRICNCFQGFDLTQRHEGQYGTIPHTKAQRAQSITKAFMAWHKVFKVTK